MVEQTLLLIKPDAVAQGLVGKILARVEGAGFAIRRLKLVALSSAEARRFYHVHKDRPFFTGLTDFMTSGPICAVVLEAEDAVESLRALVGRTDPTEAAAGTIRREFGRDTRHNAVHASDGPGSAAEEIAFFGLSLNREGTDR